MKPIYIAPILLFTFLIASCEKSGNSRIEDDDPTIKTTISISDFSTTIDENPISGMLIGTVEANTNQGSLIYSITEQSPNNAIAINSTTGEITTLSEDLFDFEVNPIITGKVRIKNGDVSEIANITINLNDVEETTVNHQPIYFFQSGSLRSLNLNNEDEITIIRESTTPLTSEIYSIAYDPFDGTYFGATDYNTNSSSFESYNPETGEKIKNRVCDCNHHSVTVNTKANKKIFVKYAQSFDKFIFQEVNSQGEIIFESSEIDLGTQVTDFIYIPTLDAYIAKDDNYSNLDIFIIDANSYNLQTVTIDIDYPSDSDRMYRFINTSLNYDRENDIIYYPRTDGLYVINVNSKSAEKLETNWIEFFKSELGSNDELDLVKSIYYPPTNEIIISGNAFFGSSVGRNKFFALNLTTNQLRELYSIYSTFYRVYGFATKN